MITAQTRVALLMSSEFRSIDPALRGHWHVLTGYVSLHESSGFIRGARHWPDSTWLINCGFGLRTLKRLEETKLITWHGDDLEVFDYQLYGEDATRASRERLRKASYKRWGK